MANYRAINPHGDVVDTKEIASAADAHAWFVDSKADNSELGWKSTSTAIGSFDDTEGDRA